MFTSQSSANLDNPKPDLGLSSLLEDLLKAKLAVEAPCKMRNQEQDHIADRCSLEGNI